MRQHLPYLRRQSSIASFRVRFTICFIGVPLLAVHLTCPALAQNKLTAAEAKQHVGETATVCGKVASTRYVSSTKGQPTFLNLDKPYPQQIFSIVIWGSARSKFGKPELDFKDKQICVTGKIEEYRGTPEVIANSSDQIHVE
jgi:DNA/RNA endonuclease YhcR with UshA esterase domain